MPLCATCLRGADLSLADLVHADLHNADLTGSNLFDATLAYANLETADLTGANLARARYDSNTIFPDGFSPDKHGMRMIRRLFKAPSRELR